jgi:hypothetical protein
MCHIIRDVQYHLDYEATSKFKEVRIARVKISKLYNEKR